MKEQKQLTKRFLKEDNSDTFGENKKIHFTWKKFIGYFFLGILVLGIGYLGYRFYEFKPYRVIASNVTSRSATISWVTDSAEPGMVVYKEGNTILPIWISKYGMGNGYDDRDYSNAELEAADKTQENISESEGITAEDIETEIVVTNLGTYWSHHVTIRNLDPETEYEFMVGDGLVFEKANTVDTEDSVVSTLKEDDEIRTPVPAYGIVRYYYDQEYSDDILFLRANDAVVYAYLRDEISKIESESLSSVANDEGGWYLDLSSAYTSNGEYFLNALNSEETTDVNLYFTVEGVGFGRWTIIKNLEDIAPSDSFDLVNPENEDDSDLDFQGYSFGSEDDSLVNSLVTKVKAKTGTGQDAEDSYQAYIKRSNTWQAPGTTAYGGSSTEGVGTCRGDVCGKSGTCGWVNNLDCKCVCSEQTIDIAPGTSCNCDSGGQASSTGTKKTALSEGNEEAANCSNDTSKSSKTCWSATNSCWYSTGHVAQNGLKCVSSHRWEDTDNSISNYPVKVVANDTTGKCVCDGSIKKCTLDTTQAGSDTEVICSDLEKANYATTTGKCVCDGSIKKCTLDTTQAGSDTEVICSDLEKANYGKLTDIDFEKDYCEDSWSKDLLIQDSGTNKYWSCGANHKFKEVNSPVDCTPEFKVGGTCCKKSQVSYDSETGKFMACGTNLEWYAAIPANKISINIDKLEKGETCDTNKYSWCLCYLHWEILTSIREAYPTKITDSTSRCGAKGVSTSGEYITDIFASENLIKKEILLDTENSLTIDLIPGKYIYEYDGESYFFEISEYEYSQTGGSFNLYIDVNKNGEVDETDIKLTDSATTIELEAIVQGFPYQLKQGFNFVSFPFVFSEEEINTASELLKYLNNKYNDAFYSLSKYDSGKWVMVGSNGGTYDQNDFQLIPGQGYVLKTKWDLNITLYGNEVTYESDTDSAPIRFMPGWNLVGLYGTGVKSYTAESILTDITNYEDINFTAVNVSRWVESRALYEALQRDTDGTVYGLDFPIELKKSYFIKVTEGEGNWEPGIK